MSYSQINMMVDSVSGTPKTFDIKKFKKVSIVSEEEYNYMAKGYWSQIENGLDMKKGYEIENTDGYAMNYTNYIFTFYPLMKLNADKTKSLVGYIIKAHSKVSGSDYHYAMPATADDVMIKRTFDSIRLLDYSMTAAFFQCYVKFMNGCSY
ncbi:hypothetical protein LBMAG27_25230 [Bacteroidota bacterium]|nr:hypothetical protein LBMAG27_25230 [Bacteroidota bacterium]